MKAIISNFRMGRHTKSENQMVILISGSNDKESAKKFIGKHAIWTSPTGTEIKGKITAPHGNSGAVRASFERGMPGQSIGQEVKVE